MTRQEILGFTLIEVLIATALMTFVMLLMNSAFFSMSRSSEAISNRAEQTSDIRLIRTFMAEMLSRISPLSYRDDGELKQYFTGQDRRIRFTGKLPAHRGEGGLHFIQISLSGTPPSLVLSDTPVNPGTAFFESQDNGWRQTTLLEDVETIRFSFFGVDDTGSPGWHREWSSQSQLPELIKMEFNQRQGADWPPLVASLHTTTVAGQPNLVWQ